MFERFDRIVRCREGHLFETIWVPFASVKAIRLGRQRRWQRCPVGRHWSYVTPVDEDSIDESELAAARAAHDRRVP